VKKFLINTYYRVRLVIIAIQLFIGRQILRGTQTAIVNRTDWINILNISNAWTKMMARSGTAPISKKYAKRTHKMRQAQRALVASTKRFVLP
jgi:hypothetical protein